MIDSYWDLYVAYVNKCVRDNWNNDIDPHHHEMEWNHWLPRCVFGDWPVGQWLTLKQHAIASCLQTLAFKDLCYCPWHKQHVPELLWDLAVNVSSPERAKNSSKGGKKGGEKTSKEKKGVHAPGMSSLGGRLAVTKQTGVHSPEYKASKERVKNIQKAASAGAKATSHQVWESTEDGFRGNSGNVAKHNKANGWDPNSRIRVYLLE